MRNFILCFMLLIGLLVTAATETRASNSVATAQPTVKVENRQTATATVTSEVGIVQTTVEKESAGDFIKKNWSVLAISLMGLFDVVARLTPTTKDNTILNLLNKLLDTFIPNYKKGGGRL